MIFFDHNSTTLPNQRVISEMMNLYSLPMNPSSIHSFGQRARSILNASRDKVRKILSIPDSHEIIFTSSGTESNNLAILGLSDFYETYSSTIEHTSIREIVSNPIITVDKNGLINFSELELLLKNCKTQALISIMHSNNETGVIQNIKDIASLVHKYGGILHTDASQSIGKVEFSASNLGADLITISGHKFGGPIGVGGLIFNKSLNLKPIIKGGGQEFRFRSGTHNTQCIWAFAEALFDCVKNLKEYSKVHILRDYIEKELQLYEDVIIFSKSAQRLPNTLSVSMPGVKSENQVMYFDLNGIAISAGSACSSGSVSMPYVQMSMGYTADVASRAIRISLGINNTKEECDLFLKLWKNLLLRDKND